MKKEIKQYYFKDGDVIGFNWGNVKHSREILDGKVVIDFDSKDNIVGIEIFDFDKELDKSQKEIDRIFNIQVGKTSRLVPKKESGNSLKKSDVHNNKPTNVGNPDKTFLTKTFNEVCRIEGKIKSLEQKYATEKSEAMRELKNTRSIVDSMVDSSEQQTVPKDEEMLWKDRYYLGQKVFCETIDRLKDKINILENKRKYWEKRYKEEYNKNWFKSNKEW